MSTGLNSTTRGRSSSKRACITRKLTARRGTHLLQASIFCLIGISTPVYGQATAAAKEHQAGTSKTPATPTRAAAQEPRLRLEDLERMALASNPTLGQAAAEIRAAAGRTRQAGRYPNPTVGITGDEIASGPIIRGGELGGFFEQRFVTAGKLGLSRRVAEQEQAETGQSAQAQRYRILNAVRALYYQALGDQRLVELRQELSILAGQVGRISRELANVGQADRPDVLAAEIEAQRLDLGLTIAQNSLQRTWRQLAAIVNNPGLGPAPLEGDLEKIPHLELEQELENIFRESPELRAAQIETTRSELVVRRARAEWKPDIVVRGGLRYNRELLEQAPMGGGLRPVGKEGFFDIGVQLPIFDRNQGAIAAARAEAERSRLGVERTKLALRSRLAAVYKDYQDSLATANRYGKEMIPRAKQSYELYLSSFRQMAAAYPQVLIAQRNLFQLQEDYITALVNVWQNAVAIQGLLVSGGPDSALQGPMGGSHP